METIITPPQEETFTPVEVAQAFCYLWQNGYLEKKQPPPQFTSEELKILTDYVIHKPPTIELKVRQRARQGGGNLTYRQSLFVKYYFETMGNGAEAARRAGYSLKCARQIAYKTLNSINSRRYEADID